MRKQRLRMNCVVQISVDERKFKYWKNGERKCGNVIENEGFIDSIKLYECVTEIVCVS